MAHAGLAYQDDTRLARCPVVPDLIRPNLSCAVCRYKPGDYVRVKVEDSSTRYRKPHLRTPGM